MLAEAGLVRDLRRGREHLWALDPTPLDAARRYLELASDRWDSALARLAAIIEADA